MNTRAQIDQTAAQLQAELLVDDLEKWLVLRGHAVAFNRTVNATAAAAALGIKPSTLANLRTRGDGPDFHVVRRAPRYTLLAIVQHLSGEAPSP